MSGAQEWTVVAPLGVGWTPSEVALIGEALQILQAKLPGAFPQVRLDGLEILPTPERMEELTRCKLSDEEAIVGSAILRGSCAPPS